MMLQSSQNSNENQSRMYYKQGGGKRLREAGRQDWPLGERQQADDPSTHSGYLRGALPRTRGH